MLILPVDLFYLYESTIIGR